MTIWGIAAMNDAGSLQNLNDIVVPEPVAWWPPAPGWYEVKALWFQRLNTSCLLMEWRPPGAAEFDWTPNGNFAYAW